MKKIVFVFVLAVLGCCKVMGQDTICTADIRALSDRYFIPEIWPHFPEDYLFNNEIKKYLGSYGLQGFGGPEIKCNAFYMYSEDTLTVYGIAAALPSGKNYYLQAYPDMGDPASPFHNHPDTNTSNYYTWMMLWEAEQDSLRELVDSAELYVHAWQRPEYYFAMDVYDRNMWNTKLPVLPMYERYFSTPVSVVDSFYVGYLSRPRVWSNGLYEIASVRFISNPQRDTTWQRMAVYMVTDWQQGGNPFEWEHGGDTVGKWYYMNSRPPRDYPIFFPILAPRDTTSVIPPTGSTDSTATEGIGEVNMVSRYTTVIPNPATATAKVTSSFLLSDIEAYDAAGHQVCRQEASGHVAQIDVSAWPRGVYMLHITTSVGTTVKKLLVQ